MSPIPTSVCKPATVTPRRASAMTRRAAPRGTDRFFAKGGVSRSDGCWSVALPAVRSGELGPSALVALPAVRSAELRPSALVADRLFHPPQAVPSLALASSDIPGLYRRACRHRQYVWPLQAPLAWPYDVGQTNRRQIPSSLRARILGSPRT